jgi:hypothetical protein
MTMPQLVTQIVLVDQDYGLAYGDNKAQAVVEYVNGLGRRYFRLEELPPHAVRSYYADYYMAQVLKGDIHQFVYNSRWNPIIVESVTAALDAMGLADQAALFGKVRDFVERDRPRLEAFLAGEYGSLAARPYMDALSKIGGDFFERFTSHPDGREAGSAQIAVANAAWISSWPDTKWVSADAFERELDSLATVIPDLLARKQQAEERKPWQYKRIEEVTASAGHKFERLTGLRRNASAAGMRGDVWHLRTDRGHHRVMFIDGEAIMLHGDQDEIVARVPAPEAG